MKTRRSAIARRCNKAWTAADERAMRLAVGLLATDVKEAGGIVPWIEHRLEAWLAEGGRCTPVVR